MGRGWRGGGGVLGGGVTVLVGYFIRIRGGRGEVGTVGEDVGWYFFRG